MQQSKLLQQKKRSLGQRRQVRIQPYHSILFDKNEWLRAGWEKE